MTSRDVRWRVRSEMEQACATSDATRLRLHMRLRMSDTQRSYSSWSTGCDSIHVPVANASSALTGLRSVRRGRRARPVRVVPEPLWLTQREPPTFGRWDRPAYHLMGVREPALHPVDRESTDRSSKPPLKTNE